VRSATLEHLTQAILAPSAHADDGSLFGESFG